MGGEKLNGFLTPPAFMYIREQPVATPVSRWTYAGPKAAFTLMPAIALPFITAADVPRFVVWELDTTVTLGGMDFDLTVTIEKKASSNPPFFVHDTYWVTLILDGLTSDQELEHFPGSTTIYTLYEAFLIGQEWTWINSGLPTQRVSSTDLYPMAWDRVLPGPPFPA